MPPQPLKKCRPLGTSAVLVETSIGAFVVDLYGLDCPVATAEFVNMCRCKYFNGCIATEVVPDNIIVFSHPVEEMRSLTFHSLLEKANTQKQGSEKEALTHANQLIHLEWERMKRYVAHLQRGGGRTAVHFLHVPATETAGAINRRGLLLAEVPSRANPSSSGDVRRGCSLVLTLGNRHLDYFEDRFMVLGEVREGLGVIEKLRAAPYQHPSSSSLIGTRPTRLVRIKHATVLPTAGTEVFPDVWSNAEGINISSNNSNSRSNSSQERKRLGPILTTTGCFRHWAVREKVQTANRMIIGILKDTFAAVETEEGAKHSEGIRFFLISEKSTKEPSKQSNNDDTDEVQSVEYNPHYHGDYLSSDDEAPQTKSRKKRENRHQAVMRLHQDKLNETRALMLNLLDGVADVTGELKPPDNVLFVCKLNPFTTSEGLKMCFSQYGRVVSAEVIRDRRTDNSLCYGFVEFEDVEECYRAFQKMDRALVDDHRIHVDFSQSVSKLWAQRQRDMRKRARVED